MAQWIETANDLQVGDLVFIRVANFLYRRVADATGSWTSHVGMIDHREGDEWVLAESKVPLSRYCPLTQFLQRSEGGRHAILRLRNPPDEAAQRRLQAEAARRIGIGYHLGFDLDSRRQFCSKFVYEVYRGALGLEVGTVLTFAELLERNPMSPLAFWRFWFLGRIPWTRRTITPRSQLESDLFVTVREGPSGLRQPPLAPRASVADR